MRLATAIAFAFVCYSSALAQPRDNTPPWVGKWYLIQQGIDIRQCDNEDSDSVIVYTPRQRTSSESLCRIQKAQQRGSATEMQMKCAAEGETSNLRLMVDVVGGRLREVHLARRGVVGVFGRCPARTAAAPATPQPATSPAVIEPGTFRIGYDGEGKIENSPAACARELAGYQWPKEQVDAAARKICAARSAHIVAYDDFQTTFAAFIKQVSEDRRLSAVKITDKLKSIIRDCIDYKLSLTNGGHNIQIDILPNQAAESCLKLGTSLISGNLLTGAAGN